MRSRLFKYTVPIFMILFIFITPVSAFGTDDTQGVGSISEDGYIQGEYIIQYDTGLLRSFSVFSSLSVLPTEVLVKYNATTVNITTDGLALVATDEPLTPAEEQKFIQELEKASTVKRVERNRIVTAFLVDELSSSYNDPFVGEQWALDSIRAFSAWDNLPEDMITVKVAVIDTGADSTHPDLAGRVISGYNTLDTNSAGQRYNETDTTDDHGHGTHVSGIIAAVCDNRIGIQGTMGPVNIEIMPIKALDDDGYGTTYSLVRAINYAAQEGADIINMSLGSSYPSELEREAVREAQNKNCLIIAAAGNDSTNVSSTYPASYSDVVAVGSVDRDDSRSYFSNYGNGLYLSAPGGSILSTIPKATAIAERAKGSTVYGDDNTGYYTVWSGTSMATPYVVGVAALYKATNPNAMNFDISNHIVETARDVGDIGKDIYTGAGVVDAAAALGSEMIKTALRLVSPSAGSELYQTVVFRAQVNMTMGIKEVRYYLNDTDSEPIATVVCDSTDSYYDYTFDTNKVADGDYTLIALAYDEAGDPVGDPAQVSVTILNHITNGFTLKVERPDAADAAGAYVIVYGLDGNGAYQRLQSAYATSLGYARIKGLKEYDSYLFLVNESYTAESGNTYYVYQRQVDKSQLGDTILIDGTASTLGRFSMKGREGTELSRPYLMVAPAYEAGGDPNLLTTYSPWRISAEDKIYLDDGLYAAYAYWSPSLDGGQAGSAYYLAQWNKVKGNTNNMIFDYTEAVLVRPVFDPGVSGTLRLEQISGESVIPFFSGAITGSEIYLPPGKYNALVDLTAARDGKTWTMQLSKPEPIVAEGELVEIHFSTDIKILTFTTNAGLREEEDGTLYMYRGDTLRTKNELSDVNGNIIKNIMDNYPTFAIYQIIDGQRTLIYQATTRYLSDACHWFSSSDYIGNTAPGIGTYLAELSFDPSPFSEKSTMSFQFELRDKDGTEKQGVNLKMGSYHLPYALVDIYSWEDGGWSKTNSSSYQASSSGNTSYLEIPKNISLSSQGINLAVIRYSQRQSGYNYPESYLGYQIVPFSQLAELEIIDLPAGEPIRVDAYDKSGNRVNAALYMPIMSDGDGRLAKPYLVGLVRTDITNSYGGYTVNLSEGQYEYAFTSFSNIGEYYYLQQDQVSISSGATLTFDGRESKMLTLNLPSGYSTYNFAPDASKGNFVINAATATKFLLSPGVYDPTLTVNYGDTRLAIKAGQALDLSAANQTWNIADDFAPQFSPASPVVALNQNLNVSGAFKDSYGNTLIGTNKKQGLNYPSYLPQILLTKPDTQGVTLDAAYQNFIILSSAYSGLGEYSFYFIYDAGQGQQHSGNITFRVGDDSGAGPVTVEQDSRYTCVYGEAGEATLTIHDTIQGFNELAVQVSPSSDRKTVAFIHMRNGEVIGSIYLTRVFSAGNNLSQCCFNLRPGDTVIIKVLQ